MTIYTGRRVLVAGGTGFLGSHVVSALIERGAIVTIASRNPSRTRFKDVEVRRCDLTIQSDCELAVRGMDYVFQLAAHGYGIGSNLGADAELFHRNVAINCALLDAACRGDVQRYLLCSSSSVYSGRDAVLDDEGPWTGDPHPSELGFGWAKRVAEVQARIYASKSSMQIAIVRPANPYGPFDLFDPGRSHVIPAMILRALSREEPFVVWGTGRAVRSFVYAPDVAVAMLAALEQYAICDPVNIAAEERTSIAALARVVLDVCGFPSATIRFDPTKPEGHPGRHPTTTKAKDRFGWVATTPLEVGVRKTVAWYLGESVAGMTVPRDGIGQRR